MTTNVLVDAALSYCRMVESQASQAAEAAQWLGQYESRWLALSLVLRSNAISAASAIVSLHAVQTWDLDALLAKHIDPATYAATNQLHVPAAPLSALRLVQRCASRGMNAEGPTTEVKQ